MANPAQRLTEWFKSRPRDVPGRDESDPYRVWVAEVMAQQTRIRAMAPRYTSFVKQFPGVEALASAHLDDVLKAWEGLGYYGRARNLHRAAREVPSGKHGRPAFTAGHRIVHGGCCSQHRLRPAGARR
jgi:A/G-specific adenine glycosylase